MRVRVKRLYEPAEESDGTRILVDGLWPRGVRKAAWPHGSWRPDLAPSRELREWYRHDPQRFDDFEHRYLAELEGNEGIDEVLAIDGQVTLITTTRDVEKSHAAVLRNYLESRR
ncbi:MAG: DUF488 family protein [Acidimicrobiia bacterium]